ncbi:MAG: hypothetical protein LBJ24_02440 [Treponema sp.]|jgi:hypothetical protein|nr:hypothetical protein [Treponema sp.]
MKHSTAIFAAAALFVLVFAACDFFTGPAGEDGQDAGARTAIPGDWGLHDGTETLWTRTDGLFRYKFAGDGRSYQVSLDSGSTWSMHVVIICRRLEPLANGETPIFVEYIDGTTTSNQLFRLKDGKLYYSTDEFIK